MNSKSSEFDPSWQFILGFYLKKYSKETRNIYELFFLEFSYELYNYSTSHDFNLKPS